MRVDYTHLFLLLDSSGSMSNCWETTIASLDKLIQDQKQVPGKMTLTLVEFDGHIREPKFNFADIQSIESLRHLRNLGGMTALNDAFCNTVDVGGQKLAAMSEESRPQKILFVVMTDGMENASRINTIDNVRDKLKHQKDKYNWNFLFLGADFDAQGQAKDLGVADFGVNFGKFQMASAMNCVSTSFTKYRGKMDGAYTADDVKELDADIKS